MGNRRVASYFFLVVFLVVVGTAPRVAHAVPSFARQTNLPCKSCHTQFPELNSFGRAFKLNGYTMRNIPGIKAIESNGRKDLTLTMMPLVSAMFQVSLTDTKAAQPGTIGTAKNGDVLFPDQASLFFAGAMGPSMGEFVQFTFDGQDGSFALDNAEFRFARTWELGGKPLVYGLTLNNNPTVQDLWNSTPAWGYPFASSSVTPGPIASTLIDGGLAQQVAGLTGYALWNDLLYTEVGAYRSAPVGVPRPLDGMDTNVIAGGAPYWRVALERQWHNNYFELGTYGLSAKLYPGGGTPLSGPTDQYTDTALDFTYQRSMGENSISAHGTWIHEARSLDATFDLGGAAKRSGNLDTLRLDATYHLGQRYAFTVAPFLTMGNRDMLLYAPEQLTGSRNGKPDTSGVMLEADFNYYENARLGLQYTAYNEFNGSRTNYDGFGRDASDNNTVYALWWFVY